MKIRLFFLITCLLGISSLSAVPQKANCPCKNCACTPEKHCGCYSNEGCHCSSKAVSTEKSVNAAKIALMAAAGHLQTARSTQPE